MEMNAAGALSPERYFAETLRRSAGLLRLKSKICATCDLKPLCYRDRESWEGMSAMELVRIKESCPIKGPAATAGTEE
ncbi:MAG: hypothetical protein U9P14_09670 [Gemmatimonadota bacterium]|nr:hypothetical protein [Gemmatimonadota bacterium]